MVRVAGGNVPVPNVNPTFVGAADFFTNLTSQCLPSAAALAISLILGVWNLKKGQKKGLKHNWIYKQDLKLYLEEECDPGWV